MRIVSWNIRKAVGLDWRRRPDRVLKVLAEIRADIVLLQEADKRLGDRESALPFSLIAEITGLTRLDVADNDISLGWHGNAILVAKDLAPTRIEQIELPGIEPRGAVLASLAGGRGEITVVGTHLGLRRACRLRQVPVIFRHLRAAGFDRAVIGADTNEWRRGPNTLPHPPRWQMVSPGLSFHTARPMAELDRFLLSPGLAPKNLGVIKAADSRRASDHLPVWIDI